MKHLDDVLVVAGEETSLRRLHAAGRIEANVMDHRQTDDWGPGSDLFYVQDRQSLEMWPVSRETWNALRGEAT